MEGPGTGEVPGGEGDNTTSSPLPGAGKQVQEEQREGREQAQETLEGNTDHDSNTILILD